MSAIAETLQDSRKIVIKVGSNVMSTPDGHIDREAVGSIVEQINVMVNDGKEIIVVSSGAGAFGAGAINKLVRRKDVHYYQALCAIGQVEMMMAYKEFFGKNGTHGDIPRHYGGDYFCVCFPLAGRRKGTDIADEDGRRVDRRMPDLAGGNY